jgi:hypothetical protein
MTSAGDGPRRRRDFKAASPFDGGRCGSGFGLAKLHPACARKPRGAVETGGGLRTLYLIEDLDEIEPGALWADAKLSLDVGVRHHKAWERSAIVTDIDWMARATKLFAWMIPGEARVFRVAELEQAKAWVAGDGA